MSSSEGICIEKKGTTWKMTVGAVLIMGLLGYIVGDKVCLDKTDAQIVTKTEYHELEKRVKAVEDCVLILKNTAEYTKETLAEIKQGVKDLSKAINLK